MTASSLRHAFRPRFFAAFAALCCAATGCGNSALDPFGSRDDSSIDLDGLSLGVASGREASRFRDLEADPGTRLVLVEVELDNEPRGSTVSLAPAHFAVRSDQGAEFLGLDAGEHLDGPCTARTMLPGGAVHSCSLVFEVPLERAAALLVYRPHPAEELNAPLAVEPCTRCGDDCVDLATDAEHCGVCFESLAVTEVCEEGVPVCWEGLTRCGSDCVDTNADQYHCGACEFACPAHGECIDARCVE